MKVVVIGGSGHLGSLAVQALARAGVDVEVASRRAALRVDLSDPSTFSALDGADVVVDVADTTTVAPDALAAHCLERGLVLVEASSDPAALERLGRLRGRAAKGAVILGAGIFTGISNLLARRAFEDAPGAEGLRLGVSSSPYSAAGGGTIALMVAALARRGVRFVGGARVEGAACERGPRLAFPSGERPTLRMSFAEQEMLAPSTGARETDVLFAPVPALLVWAFTMLPAALVRARLFQALMRGYFHVLRRGLLRGVRSRVEMVAEAGGARRTAWAGDGMAAGGNAIAAIALAVAERRAELSGVRFVDEVLALEPVVARANALARRDLERVILG